MTQGDTWLAVDDYIVESFLAEDPVLDAAQAACDAAGLPKIQIAPLQGKLLMMLASALQAQNILEVGTLGGYSTIWLARGLAEGGRVTTLERDPRHAEIARSNFDKAGFGDRIEVRLGPALETMAALHAENAGPFDLVFIDADKPSTPDYFDAAVKLARLGTLIVVDNVVQTPDAGAVDHPRRGDPGRPKRQKARQRPARVLCPRRRRSARDRYRLSDGRPQGP